MGPLFPANGAEGICPDVSLHLRFDAKPSLGSGKISVFEQGSSTAVASVDVAARQTSVSPSGTQLTFLNPVFVVDREVIVQLPAALDYGKSYYVTVDSSAVRGTGGALPLAGEADWSFSTRAAAPTDMSQLRIAQDGTGDFCSVQAGLEAAPSGAMVSLGRGFYHELVKVSGKTGVTLRGDDRKGTVILGVNNDSLNSGTAKRALVSIEKSTDLIIERLTIHNLTEQGGSQAEALRLQACDKCVVRDADILSLQDTLLWDGRIYAKDLYVAGNVDFVWGKGAVFFDHCEIKTVGRKGYVVQSRNEPDGYGYVFVDSKISADPGVTGIVLARIDASVYPGSHVAFVNCEMGRHIAPEGWTITGGGGSALRFWEYQSTAEGGGALDISRRHPSSRQITADQAAAMRDPAMVLGGWQPPQ
jgi:pectin methylesterase-like acyl-CoA thioesterase